MANAEIDVSIIYVNYHTSQLIKESIKTILDKVKNISYEIIIVDNNSEKNIESIFKDSIFNNLKIKCVYLPDNIGFGRANNEGAKHALGKNLFFLNPDTLLLNNAVKILNDFLIENPDAGACGGNLYNKNNAPSYSFRKILPGIIWDFNELTHNLFSYPLNQRKNSFNFSNQPIIVSYISGADLMIPKEIFKECNGFSKDLFMYWDDVEICKRIKELNYNIYNVPASKICHLESQSFENIKNKNNFKIELQEQYRLIYLKRNLNNLQYKITNLIYYLFLETRILGVFNKNKNFYYKKRKEFFIRFKNEE